MTLVMNDTITESGPREKFLQHFQTIDFSFDSPESRSLREAAKIQLQELDFPSTKAEYWKYTKVNELVKKEYEISASEANIDVSRYRYPVSTELVFVNGFYRHDLSNTGSAEGILVCPLSVAKERYPSIIAAHLGKTGGMTDEIFAVMNAAYHNDGAFIFIEKNKKIEEPVHVLHLLQGDHVMAMPRNLIVAGEGSAAKIIESFEGMSASTSFVNSLSEIYLKENSRLEFNKIQDFGPENSHIATEQIEQARNSKFDITTFSLSGKLLRNNLNVILNEENASCHLNGMYLSKGNQHVDNHTLIDHKAPYCQSFEIYKGILNERSTGVFNGRVLVRQAAQKTNAFQSNANILLTDEATANSKPELEIYADDVKCSHGSTTGQLDEEALFYLRTRGIDETKARNLLLCAFAGEVLEKSTIEPVKDKIGNYIAKRYHNPF